MELLKAALYGVLEGITEWLPVSSTGHLILLKKFWPMNVSDEFFSMFEVVIQLGAIIAVVALFWNQLWPFSTKEKHWVKQDVLAMWLKIAVACIPVVVVELLIGDYIEDWFYNEWVIAGALIIFGIAFIVVENRNAKLHPKMNSIADITYQAALIIGMFQVIAAVFPGTSRSGATILGALMIGVARSAAAEFTFYLAVPVMFGAGLLKILEFGSSFTTIEISILMMGTSISLLVSMIVIQFFMGYIKKHDFKIFGWYRIILGLVVLTIFSL